MPIKGSCEVCKKELAFTVETVKVLSSSIAIVNGQISAVLTDYTCLSPPSDCFIRNRPNGDIQVLCSKACMERFAKETSIDKKPQSQN